MEHALAGATARDANAVRPRPASVPTPDALSRASGAWDASARPGCQPLVSTARAAVEPRFGHDFAQVRVHPGADCAGPGICRQEDEESGGAGGDGAHAGHGHAGWMDRAFGLNPDRSFVEAGMDLVGYGRTGLWGRPPAPDEGTGTTLLRAGGAALCSPAALYAAIGGHTLDELNHGPSILHGMFDE